jgi:hypothetical protein
MKTLASKKISIQAGSLGRDSTATSEIFEVRVFGYPLPGFAIKRKASRGHLKGLKGLGNALFSTFQREMLGLELSELAVGRFF